MRSIVVAKRVLLELLRDKRTLALLFFAPVLILFLLNLMFAASTDVKVKLGTSGLEPALSEKLAKVKGVRVKNYQTTTLARADLKNYRLDGVISYQADKYTVTYANLDASKTQLTKQALKQALLSQQLAGLQANLALGRGEKSLQAKMPVVVNHYQYGDSQTNFFTKLIPVLMGFFTFFFVFLISGLALLKERTSGTLARLLATPIKRSELVYGYTLGYGLVACLQASLIALVSIYLLKLEVVGSLVAVVVVSVCLGFVALAFGILLSTFASSEFQMMQFIPLVVVPQIFFSGIIPLASLAPWAQVIGRILPLTYAGDALSKIIMQGATLRQVSGDLLVLVGFLVCLLGLNILGLKRYRKV